MRVTILLFIFISSLVATDINAKYKVTFGIFGEIGIAETSLHVDGKKSYKIDVHVMTTGFANFVSGGREEWYTSYGRVDKNGIFIPDVYKKIVKRTVNESSFENFKEVVKIDTKKYIFLHEQRAVKVEQSKQRNDEIRHESKVADYYAPNDLLSLFFNFRNILPSLEIKKPRVFYAVGARKEDGRIDIEPVKDALHVRDEFDWDDGHMMKAIINQKIFASKRGELIINLGSDGLAKNAVLKDVILFGDIKGKLIE